MIINKRAVSLITLVITIIIMIILAGAILITLSNSDIFNKASDSVNQYNLKQVQTMASVIWSEGYLDEEVVLNEEYIKEKLSKQGVDVSKYNFVLTERGVEVQLKDSSASVYGIYFDRLYEVGETENKEGFVFHADGSLEYYETINGILFCSEAHPKDTVIYQEGKVIMGELVGLVSQDGMTITDESGFLSLKCNFTDINGIFKNKTYSDATNAVAISMDNNNIGTMSFAGATQKSEVVVTGTGHMLTVLGNTFYVSLDGNHIYWKENSLVLDIEEETVVVGDWEAAWVYKDGAWSERIDKGGNATGDFVVKVYPLNKKVTPVAPNGNSIFETIISGLSMTENTAYKMVIEGSGEMPTLYTATYDENDNLLSETPYAWQKEGVLGILIDDDEYTNNGTFYNFYITDVEIGENITSLGAYSLAYMPSLKNVSIPNSVVNINGYAFAFTGLTSITLPNNLLRIGASVFSGSCITSINIPNSVASIGNSAFEGCQELINVTLPNKITEIPKYAFSNCSKLENITIPSKVKVINEYAFYGASSLKNVRIEGSELTTVGVNAFMNISSGSTILIVNSAAAPTIAPLFVNSINYDSTKTTIR